MRVKNMHAGPSLSKSFVVSFRVLVFGFVCDRGLSPLPSRLARAAHIHTQRQRHTLTTPTTNTRQAKVSLFPLPVCLFTSIATYKPFPDICPSSTYLPTYLPTQKPKPLLSHGRILLLHPLPILLPMLEANHQDSDIVGRAQPQGDVSELRGRLGGGEAAVFGVVVALLVL